jgi:copper chaperone CopZ
MNNKHSITCLGVLLPLLFIITATAHSSEIKRTSLQVANLSCTSCLAAIENGLMGLPGVIGMDGDVSTGLVIVDHQPEVKGETIAGAIISFGYPAQVDWTADIDDRQAINFSARSRFATSGCGGGCSTSGGAASGQQVWNPSAAQSGTVIRTTLQVAQLSCSSCLANIEAELKTMPGTVGMIGDVRQGLVVVDHLDFLPEAQIAEAITKIGYPATISNSGVAPAGQAKASATPDTSIASRISGSNCNSRNCRATASAWKELYRKYVAESSTK